MREKTNKGIAAVIYQWLDKAVAAVPQANSVSLLAVAANGLFPGAAQQLLLMRC
jgi:hypothetical protein